MTQFQTNKFTIQKIYLRVYGNIHHDILTFKVDRIV